MSAEFARLPIEIFDKIFQDLQRQSLMECQRVCQSWYPHATRHFMKNIGFHNENKLIKFLNCQPGMKSEVKKMGVSVRSGVYSKECIKKLIMKLPNLQELVVAGDLLPLFNSDDVELPSSLTSITVCYYNQTHNIYEFIKLMVKVRNSIQKFEMAIEHKDTSFFKSWDMIAFFSSFPKLKKLDMHNVELIINFGDYLRIIQATPTLKSIIFRIKEDINSDFNNTIQFKQRLATFEMLSFTAYTFLPHTFSFIVRNFVGLKKIYVRCVSFFINNLNYSTAFLELLDFAYTMDTYSIRFQIGHTFYIHCLSNILSNTFTHLPENSQNVFRYIQIFISSGYELGYDNHDFVLDSYRDLYYRLRRDIIWDIRYNKYNVNELLNCIRSLDRVNVDIIQFNMFYSRRLFHYFDIFLELLSLFIEPKRIILIVSSDSKWPKYKPSNRLNHITQLEIQVRVKNGPGNKKLTLSLDALPNLKTLHLLYYCGIWYPDRNTYSLQLPMLNLETLYLDVAPLVSKAKDLNSENFMLVIKTSTLLDFYKVSVASLHATKILHVKPEKIQKNDCIQLYIKLKNIKNLNLHVSGGYLPDKASSPIPYYKMKTLILL